MINTSVRLLPGSRCAYPGYGSTAVCGPVARVRRLYIDAASSRVALRLPGLRVHRRLRAGSPDRRSAPPPGKPG
ncbi:MAG: hypothetical protein E7G12_10410 [Klebsiella michiganensis]|nr:hypothetical protein [Klebsiella michiganensis]